MKEDGTPNVSITAKEQNNEDADTVLAFNVQKQNNVDVISISIFDGIMFKISTFKNDGLETLESILLQNNVHHILYIEHSPDKMNDNDTIISIMKKVEEIAESNDMKLVPCTKHQFKLNDQLNTFVREDAHQLLYDSQFEDANRALSAIIDHEKIKKPINKNMKWELAYYNVDKTMRIDAIAIRALNILPSKLESHKSMNLYATLNKCLTRAGSRLLKAWILQPERSLAKIKARHDIVEAFLNATELSDIREIHLQVFPNIEKLINQLSKGNVQLMHLVRLYQAAQAVPHMIQCLKQFKESVDESKSHLYETLHRELIVPFESVAVNLQKYLIFVEEVIDISRIAQNEYFINAKHSQELSFLEKQRNTQRKAIQDIAETMLVRMGIEGKIYRETNSNKHKGYCISVTKRHDKVIRRHDKLIILDTQKSGIRWTNRKLQKASENFEILTEEYESKQRALIRQAIEAAQTYIHVFRITRALIAKLDVLSTFAVCSETYCRPEMYPENEQCLSLLESRHPCVEHAVQSFIPNSLSMDKGQFVIITGPNMGGKSTFIKQVALCTLMAQIGCFVPATSAKLSVRDAIFARVGAADSQLRGASTFMAEMVEMASILRSATPQSLVIIDELGRGTSTYDGFGILHAVSTFMTKQLKCPTLVATHFHELTHLSIELPGLVQNLHVTTADGAFTMLYTIQPGVSNRSFGIEVAELTQFPSTVVNVARQRANDYHEFDTMNSRRKPPMDASKAKAYVDAVLQLDFSSSSPDAIQRALTPFLS